MHDLDPGSPDFPADVVNGLPDHPTAELEFDIVRTEQPSGQVSLRMKSSFREPDGAMSGPPRPMLPPMA